MSTEKRSTKPFLKLVRPPRPIEDVLSAIPNVSPWIQGVLRAVDDEAPGSVERAIDRVPLIRAGALDNSETQRHEGDPYDSFVTSIISTIHPECELFRVSLHVPPAVDRNLAPHLNAYAGHIAARGADHGAWLAIDRRDDGSEHAFGIIACSPDYRPNIVPRWCDLTSANPYAHRGRKAVQRITGSHHYAMTGDATSLRPNLRRVLVYGLHKLPGGAVRDLDREVVATGALVAPWGAFRARGVTSGGADPTNALPPSQQSVPRACLNLRPSDLLAEACPRKNVRREVSKGEVPSCPRSERCDMTRATTAARRQPELPWPRHTGVTRSPHRLGPCVR